MNSAALFDLDGTVMDTPAAIVASLTEMITPYGVAHPEPVLRAQIGRPLDSIVDTLLPEATVVDRDEAKQRFRVSFSAQTLPDARHLIHPGVSELLEHLRGNGVAIAIVTSKITPSAIELLLAAGIREAFDTIVGHDQVQYGKPHPDLALLAAARLDVAPAFCVVIGDSTDDIRMGIVAGMPTVGVAWGVSEAAALTDAGANLVAADLNSLTAELDRMLLKTGTSA
ncbi:HAD family hydrolase [Microbacterium imperiale]|uniref:Haloacid dehalogenase n=1 Tax=Microbacterium imperiale TaxID=33884 RepID=A0A9W6HEM0_9MICO|nr:HAD family hydrolase [Microbacterium imperiale]MBP2419967.1 HAD superfamily hydrolase (TIGR01509 family) [Microbacterium imperiale]MDS0198169.1 HAD family hydrolase [Microbacterium imperiale]BFE40307.1 HAD family hydrolase [Microbacterium imperiale]GLJ78716.1 haloacid dehalogenase [Microbacterium imperiale]